MRDAAEGRLRPIADLTRIDDYKQFFMRCANVVCPGYIVREDQRKILNDIVHWALKDYHGNLDPDRGLSPHSNSPLSGRHRHRKINIAQNCKAVLP